MKKLGILFGNFLKIGLFTFGGGYAMLALLENEFVIRRKWISKEEFLTMTAISESTPGPMAVNSATYLGYQMGGFAGALTATIAVCIPSFLIIYLISLFFDQFLSLTLVAKAFQGVKVCVVYLILSAGLRLLQSLQKTVLNTVLLLTVLVVMTVFSLLSIRFSSVFYILICGMAGVFLYLIRLLSGKRRADS